MFHDYEGTATCKEWGTRTSEVRPVCGRQMLKLDSHLMIYHGEDNCRPEDFFNPTDYPFVSNKSMIILVALVETHES